MNKKIPCKNCKTCPNFLNNKCCHESGNSKANTNTYAVSTPEFEKEFDEMKEKQDASKN